MLCLSGGQGPVFDVENAVPPRCPATERPVGAVVFSQDMTNGRVELSWFLEAHVKNEARVGEQMGEPA
eukprot:COSAG02_NODE_1250_length_13626_cov_72.701929_5_plen_68_part_00